MKRSRACEDLLALETHHHHPIRSSSWLPTTQSSPNQGWVKRNKIDDRRNQANTTDEEVTDELVVNIEVKDRTDCDRLRARPRLTYRDGLSQDSKASRFLQDELQEENGCLQLMRAKWALSEDPLLCSPDSVDSCLLSNRFRHHADELSPAFDMQAFIMVLDTETQS